MGVLDRCSIDELRTLATRFGEKALGDYTKKLRDNTEEIRLQL